jgi:hypothetical protein
LRRRDVADIAHLKALEAQATKGPWRESEGHSIVTDHEGDPDDTIIAELRIPGLTKAKLAEYDATADLIVALRNAAPAMLEVCAAAKEWRAAPTAKEIETASKRLWAALDALEARRE